MNASHSFATLFRDQNIYAYVGGNPNSFIDPLGLVEGSPNNVARRGMISSIAKYYEGSHRWDYSKNNGRQYPTNSWKCSEFVCDVLNEANAGMSVIAGGTTRCPTAGELSNVGWNPGDWRTLGPDETPEPGDTASYAYDRQFDGDGDIYTGHAGVVTDGGVTAAHADGVTTGPMNSGGRQLIHRRYTGE